MTSRRLFLASKRAPVEYNRNPDSGELQVSVAPGGTGSVVADQASYLDISWIASAMTDEDRVLARQNPDGVELRFTSSRPVTVHLLEHDPAVFESVQNYFTADLMWATNNYLWDTWRTPTFDAGTRAAWEDFQVFTRDFADALLAASDGADRPSYLLHDYQLVCVPSLIREARPDARILLFVHIPWPPADLWRVMPRYMRRSIVERMLAANTIGFFAERWVGNFLECVEDVAPEAAVDRARGTVAVAGSTCEVRAMPLGYSPQAIEHRISELPEELRRWVGDRSLVVHAGRTDPIKNAPRAIRAFILAGARSPACASANLLVRMNPNRLYVDANREYLETTRAAVAEANDQLGREAVRLVFDDDPALTLSCFARADVLFLNSTIDGQNLSAFEGVVVGRRDPQVILSETCGAAEVLASVVKIVSPFDLEEQSDALASALEMDAEARAVSAARAREVGKQYTLPRWVDEQLDALADGRIATHD